jgi:hypothetical protein
MTRLHQEHEPEDIRRLIDMAFSGDKAIRNNASMLLSRPRLSVKVNGYIKVLNGMLESMESTVHTGEGRNSTGNAVLGRELYVTWRWGGSQRSE